jgi:cytochrome c oxidase subunit III
LGTCILLASGFTVTLAHHTLVLGQKVSTLISLFITIILGIIFVILQATEYFYCTYTFADSTYGNCFFISTGLHGLHVIAGVIFLTVSLYRIYKDHYTTEHHLGFLFAAWYWHLVDVVWIFLYLVVYIWGGSTHLF